MHAVVTTNRIQLVPVKQKIGLRLMGEPLIVTDTLDYVPTIDPVKEDVIQTVSNLWEATGSIIDESGNLVTDSTIQLVVNATGQPLSDAIPIHSGSYHVWTDKSPYEVSVLFSKKGYASQKIQIIKLIDAPDVILKKSGNTTQPLAIAALLLLAAAATKKKKVGAIDTSTVLTLGAAFVLFKGMDIINQFLAALGLGKDKDDKDYEEEAANPNSPLKPAYYLAQSLTNQNAAKAAINPIATQLGETLINAFGYFNDNESQAIGVFKRFTTKTQASYFSYVWQNVWGYDDLLTWLKGDSYPNDRLDTGEIKEVTDYINNLPA